MQKHKYLKLIVLVAVTLSLAVYLCHRRHKNSDIEKRRQIDDCLYDLNFLKERLRTRPKRLESDKDGIIEVPNCEIIQIAVVCTGHTETRNVVILIKSILLNRRNPLHFHFISDSTAHHILKYMFKTWKIPSVEISFYSTTKAQSQTFLYYKVIKDTKNFYKLMLPTILPNEIEKVILFDPKTMVNVDIAELWMLFNSFASKEAIGAVENQNSWYSEASKNLERSWTILGKGVNIGVLLYDLSKLRKSDFTNTAIHLTWNKDPDNKLSYEDIFNAVLISNDNMLHYLEDKWNLQLSENSSLDYCNTSVLSNLKIVQGIPYNKFDINIRCMAVFRKLYNSYLELNGNLLRRDLSVCKTHFSSTDKFRSLINKGDDCIDFRIQQANVFRTHLYFIEYDYEPKPNDVTMVTQMTMDRLVMFSRLSYKWDGPISIALHLTEIETYEFFNFIKESFLKKRKNIGYHIVYKEGTTGLYPYNYLRNVALENVQTPYVFLNDVDFVPFYGIYKQLRTRILNTMDNKIKKALVVPAFQQTGCQLTFPKNKTELLKQFEKGQIVRFDEYGMGHLATNYSKWIQATAPYKVDYRRYYEPYMVLPKNIPTYDTRFVGFGWDKQSHTMELDADGYEFIVLPDLYTIHLSHATTYHRTMYFADSKYKRCVENFLTEFFNDLATKYGQRGERFRQLYKKL